MRPTWSAPPPRRLRFERRVHQVANRGPTAKSFDLNFASIYEQIADAGPTPGNIWCGDEAAREVVEQLIRDAGYDPVYAAASKKSALQETMLQFSFAIAQGGTGPVLLPDGRARQLLERPAGLPKISRMRLSVLDQSPISDGSTGADALRNTVDLARLADELGYHRYWVAEHHGGPMLASASPEALIGPIASVTDGIRVGSGGVMLPHYSPLKVAETFTILAGLFPGRIDLGLGRARRHRSDDDVRAPARPPAGHARRLPPAARRAARILSTTACLRTIRSPDSPECSRAGPSCPRHGSSDPPPRARSGLVSWRCRTRSRTSSTRRGPTSPGSTASGSSPPTPRRFRGPRCPSGCSARRPTRRPISWHRAAG